MRQADTGRKNIMDGETEEQRLGGVLSTVLAIKRTLLNSEPTLPSAVEAGPLQLSPGFLRPRGTLERAEKVGGRRQRLPVSCFLALPITLPQQGPFVPIGAFGFRARLFQNQLYLTNPAACLL